eukprot:291571_1
MSRGRRYGTIVTIRRILLFLLCIAILMQFRLIFNTDNNSYNTLNTRTPLHHTNHNNGPIEEEHHNSLLIDKVARLFPPVNLSSSQWDCLSHPSDQQKCTLFPGITIVFNRRIGKGFRAKLWSVNLTNRVAAAVMKYTDNMFKICDSYAMIEYDTMDKLYKYNDSLHTVSLIYDPPLHYYQYVMNDTLLGCVYFMTQLNAFGTLGDVRQTFHKLRRASHRKIKRTVTRLHPIIADPLQFVMNCYFDIVSVLHAVHSIGEYYNDFHPDQIVIDARSHRCYLVDFHDMLYLNELHSMRDLRCVWLRCPPRTYYHAWIGLHNDTKNDDILFQIEYEALTVMLNLFVDVCGNMELIDGNTTIAQRLLGLNAMYIPNDWNTWVMATAHSKKMFNRTYCRRQEIITFMRTVYNTLQCVQPSSNTSLKRDFLTLLDIYEDDEQYLNQDTCSLDKQERIQRQNKKKKKAICRSGRTWCKRW